MISTRAACYTLPLFFLLTSCTQPADCPEPPVAKKESAISHLKCTFPQKSVEGEDPLDEFAFDVAINKESSQITLTRKSGSGFKASGFFSAEHISWKNLESEIAEGVSIQLQYELDRSTLGITQGSILDLLDHSKRSDETQIVNTRKGQCEKVEIKDAQI